MPTYNPGEWNDSGAVQHNNNCYDYARDEKTGNFTQPGEDSGTPIDACSCESVSGGAQADGLTPSNKEDACPENCWKVTLVVDDSPPCDFHWYRQDDNGKWSHKPGGTEATNVDNSGNQITDPEIADRGRYNQFCGYFCVCPPGAGCLAFLGTIVRWLGISRGQQRPRGEGRMEGAGVTVHALIYSGRKNPEFRLTTDQVAILVSKLADLPSSSEGMASRLGYQGFLVETFEGTPGLPRRLRIHGGLVKVWERSGEVRMSRDVAGVEQWLLETTQNLPFGQDIRAVIAKS